MKRKIITTGSLNSGGFLTDTDWMRVIDVAYVTDLIEMYPDAFMTAKAVWAVLQSKYDMGRCQTVYRLLYGTDRVLDRPVAEAVFALAQTRDCDALFRYASWVINEEAVDS